MVKREKPKTHNFESGLFLGGVSVGLVSLVLILATGGLDDHYQMIEKESLSASIENLCQWIDFLKDEKRLDIHIRDEFYYLARHNCGEGE